MANTDFTPARDGVVAGVDGSPSAALAAEWAAWEAAARGAPLTLEYALDLPDVSVLEPSEYALRARRDGRAVLDRAAAALRERFPGLSVETHLSDLSAARALHQLSKRCALVVTGTRGHGGFPGMSLGSVSRKLAAHALCPLVVVPAGHEARRGGRNDIVLGVEPGQGTAPVEFAFTVAARYGASLTAARAWRPWVHKATPGAFPADLARIRDAEIAQVEQLLEPYRPSYAKVDVEILAWRGNAVPILNEAARDARLLVVGAHRRRGPLAVGAGYVVDGVLAHCAAPVAVVPID